MSILDNIAKLISLKAEVIHYEKLNDNVFHVKLFGDDLKSLAYTPGHHLRVLIGIGKDANFKDKVRTYSIWDYDNEKQTIDLAICSHSNGVGAEWVKNLKMGDTVYFSKPKGNFTIDNSGDYYLFIGDVSTLAHLYAIKRNLSQNIQAHSLIYSNNTNDFFEDLKYNTALNFTILNDNPTKYIIENISNFIINTNGKGIVYIAGDTRVCVALNQYFKQVLKWETKQIKTKPFWHPDKKGLE